MTEWLKVPLLQQPESKGLWFSSHRHYCVVSLDQTLHDTYLSLLELKEARNHCEKTSSNNNLQPWNWISHKHMRNNCHRISITGIFTP